MSVCVLAERERRITARAGWKADERHGAGPDQAPRARGGPRLPRASPRRPGCIPAGAGRLERLARLRLGRSPRVRGGLQPVVFRVRHVGVVVRRSRTRSPWTGARTRGRRPAVDLSSCAAKCLADRRAETVGWTRRLSARCGVDYSPRSAVVSVVPVLLVSGRGVVTCGLGRSGGLVCLVADHDHLAELGATARLVQASFQRPVVAVERDAGPALLAECVEACFQSSPTQRAVRGDVDADTGLTQCGVCLFPLVGLGPRAIQAQVPRVRTCWRLSRRGWVKSTASSVAG